MYMCSVIRLNISRLPEPLFERLQHSKLFTCGSHNVAKTMFSVSHVLEVLTALLSTACVLLEKRGVKEIFTSAT